MRKANELYTIIFSKKKLYVKFNEIISCNLWGTYWGLVQNILRNHSCEREEILHIVFDMEDCEWADPFPLMSILMELYNFIRTNRKIVRVEIIITDLKEGKTYRKGAFRKFLATQGFLEAMISCAISVKAGTREINNKDVIKYTRQNYNLKFENAEIYKMKVFEIKKNSEIDCIENIVASAMDKFKNNVSLAMYNLLEMQLYNIIAELVSNVNQHAYEDYEIKVFSVYIRKRLDLDEEWHKKEEKNCPALKNDILIKDDAVIEVFFADIGMGIENSFFRNYKKKESKYPLRVLLSQIIREGKRNDSSLKLSTYGGLHFVARILQECKGYVWCKENNEWVGALSNDFIIDKSSNIYVRNDKEEYGEPYIKGLFWGLRIPYTNSIENKKRIELVWEGEISNHPVFLAYKDIKSSIEITDDFVVIDERFNRNICQVGKEGEIIEYCLDSEETFIDCNNWEKCKCCWFPREGYTKNVILEKLNRYLSTIFAGLKKNRKATLYIGDIGSQETMCYFYALSELKLIKSKFDFIKNIVIITKFWGVLLFENRNGTLVMAPAISNNFLTDDIVSGISGFKNIGDYALFLRKYDSRIFWKTLKEKREEDVFINETIKWGPGKYIEGYLNFERIYQHRELYEIIRNVLYRTKGFVNNALIEYMNMEAITKRVCQELNKELSLYRNWVSYRIYVGGICVTGYTKDSYYRESEKDIMIAFFQHIDSDKQFKDIIFLLLWPERSFFTDFGKENISYQRMGKTNLVASENDKKLMSIQYNNINVEVEKDKMYKELGKKYPKFIKYGHYGTDNHHYLIGFDMNTYIEDAYKHRQGIICAVCAYILHYLSVDGNDSIKLANKIVDNILKDKVRERLKNGKYPEWERGDVIAYHSNSTMDYLIELVLEILPIELRSRIFPVGIVDIQQRGTPVIFSPLDLRHLKRYLNDTRGRLLYMDSAFHSGRKMVEIENTLYNIGCKKIRFYALIDFRRLRYIDRKCRSYWKIDVPRLGAASNCVICQGITEVENYIDKVDSMGKERLQQWINEWQCININSSLKDHGIENDYSHTFELMPQCIFTDTTCLNIFMAEKLCETYLNNFVYNFISGDKTNCQINVQLICTQLLLFGRQSSRRLHITLIGKLLENMAQIENANSYTSLAAITLLLQDKKLIYDVIFQILFDNENEKMQPVRKVLLQSKNEDLALVIGYFVKKSIEIDSIISDYQREKEKFVLFRNIYDRLLPEKELKLISKEFQGLYKSEQQSMRHSTGIYKLINEHVPESQPDDYIIKCKKAINEIETLCELAKHFPVSLINNNGGEAPNYKKLCDSVAWVKRNVSSEIANVKSQTETADGQICCSKPLKNAISKCEVELDKYLNAYFIASNKAGEHHLINLIDKIKEKHGRKIKVNIVKENENKWYYWNAAIEDEFIYLIDNCIHCEKEDSLKKLSHFKSADNNLYHMFINIDFGVDFLKVTFSSWSGTPANLVQHKFRHDNRLSKEYAIGFDVVFEFSDEKEEGGELFLLQSVMAIPACYQTLKGGNDNE